MESRKILNALETLSKNYVIEPNVLSNMSKFSTEFVSEKLSDYDARHFWQMPDAYKAYKSFIETYNIVYNALTSAAIIVKNKDYIIKNMKYWCEKKNCKSESIIEKFKYAEKLLINQELLAILNYGLNNYTDIKELYERMQALTIISKNEENSRELYDAITNQTTNEIGVIDVYDKTYYKDSEYGSHTRIVGTKKEMLLVDILKLTSPIHYDYRDVREEACSRDDFYSYGDEVTKEFTEPESRSERLKVYKKAVLMERAKYNLSMDEDGYILYQDKALRISKNTLIKNGIDPSFVNWKPIKYTLQSKQNKSKDKKIKALSNKILKKKLS